MFDTSWVLQGFFHQKYHQKRITRLCKMMLGKPSFLKWSLLRKTSTSPKMAGVDRLGLLESGRLHMWRAIAWTQENRSFQETLDARTTGRC